MNKQRLLKFLPRFLEDRTEDDQFNDEKAWLVKAIGNLPDTASAQPPPPPPMPAQQTSSPPSSQDSGVAQQNGAMHAAQVRS